MAPNVNVPHVHYNYLSLISSDSCTPENSKTNSIWLNVKGRPSGSVAQLAECSHGKREALGSTPGRATIFPLL